jgi:hypothetical protein
MTTGTSASVTEVSCTCKYLSDGAADPNTPIRFDPDLNEYSIVYWFGGGDEYGSMSIYHCPWCGGRTPESRRGDLFASVPESEYERLRELTAGIEALDDAFRILGNPSRDEPTTPPPGYTPPTERDEKSTWPVRVLTFENLSEVAEIQVALLSDNLTQVTFGPKYIGPLRKAV